MGKSGLVLTLMLVAACRLRFDDETLSTSAPTRFQIGASDLTSLAAVATTTGFGLVTARAGGAVTGSAYDFKRSQLVASMENEQLATSATGAIGAASIGSGVLMSALDGSPATGTSLYPFGGELAPTAAASARAGELAVTNPIASGAGFAFATSVPTLEVDARFVSSDGLDANAPTKIIDAAEKAGEVSIVNADNGFVVSYTAAATSPHAARVELLDATLAVVTAPVTANNTAYGAFHVRVAWASESRTYLVTWAEKDSAGTDDVFAQIRDEGLGAVTAPTVIAQHSVNPAVSADSTGFWVVWKNTSVTPNFLESAHVAPDGTLTPRAVTNSGGAPGQWTLIERLDQPVLVWTEIGGTGPDLYFDASE